MPLEAFCRVFIVRNNPTFYAIKRHIGSGLGRLVMEGEEAWVNFH